MSAFARKLSIALDIVPERVAMLNRKQSPTVDTKIEYYLRHEAVNMSSTLHKREFHDATEFAIIAAPNDMPLRPTTSIQSQSRPWCITP